MRSAASEALARFQSKMESFEDVFRCLFPAERLRQVRADDEYGFPRTDDELLRYIRRSITGEDYRYAVSVLPVYLNDALASADFVGGIEPRIGNRHIRVIAIDGFPPMSYPGILGVLDSLPIEYRWNTRAILMDPQALRTTSKESRARLFMSLQ